MKNKRLEMLSDKVRKGESIDFSEALEVIEYQTKLRQASFTDKLLRLVNKLAHKVRNIL